MLHRLFIHVAGAGATGLEPSPTAPYLRGNPNNIASFCPKFSSRKARHMVQVYRGFPRDNVKHFVQTTLHIKSEAGPQSGRQLIEDDRDQLGIGMVHCLAIS
jgi:hypothetical protein